MQPDKRLRPQILVAALLPLVVLLGVSTLHAQRFPNPGGPGNPGINPGRPAFPPPNPGIPIGPPIMPGTSNPAGQIRTNPPTNPNFPNPNFPNTNVPNPNFPNTNVPNPNFPNTNVPNPNFPNTNVPNPNFPNTNIPVIQTVWKCNRCGYTVTTNGGLPPSCPTCSAQAAGNPAFGNPGGQPTTTSPGSSPSPVSKCRWCGADLGSAKGSVCSSCSVRTISIGAGVLGLMLLIGLGVGLAIFFTARTGSRRRR
jgi:hypothetical protein